MDCNGCTFEELPPTDKNCSGEWVQWVAMGGLWRNYPLIEIARQEWASMDRNGSSLRNCHPLTKIAMESGYNGLQSEHFWWIATHWKKLQWRVGARGCNGRTFEELLPYWNSQARVSCNGLQWEHFWGITIHWLKLSWKSGLHWAATGGLLRYYHTLTKKVI